MNSSSVQPFYRRSNLKKNKIEKTEWVAKKWIYLHQNKSIYKTKYGNAPDNIVVSLLGLAIVLWNDGFFMGTNGTNDF